MERPNHSKASIKKFEADLHAKEQFNKVHTRPMPNFEKKKGEIKFNAAAIIREEALLQKKQDEEEQVLKDFEMNL